MTVFNFDIKRKSYEAALKMTQSALAAGNIEEGKYYLSSASGLCAQLIANCVVEPMKRRYEGELHKLQSLSASLEKGVNPFSGERSAPKGVADTGGASRAGAGRAEAQGGGGELQFFSEKAPTTTLNDVAGLAEVKKQIRLRVLAPLQNPELYSKYMDDAGCRILMYGPPGCGKSFVAEAIAGELKCAYAIINASDLLDKYVGEGPKKVVQIFKEAERFEKCLIFFDELDSLFASRESDDSRHTKDILTTFLTCLSGFHEEKSGCVRVIIGATNRPWALDTALIRGKRFDTHIYVGLPDAEARAFLVRKAFSKNASLLGGDIGEERMVDVLDGYSCADISTILGKMKEKAFERTLENFERGVGSEEPVTERDLEEVMASYRNSVTAESLELFKSFENGEI